MSAAPEPTPAPVRLEAREEFDAVYRRFWPRLMQHALRRHGPRDAEEITQETLARGFRHLDLSRSEGEMWAWLSQVCRSVAGDLARRRQLCDADGSSLEQLESRECSSPSPSCCSPNGGH